MPHKRNPVGAAVVLAAAIRAPGLVATMLSRDGAGARARARRLARPSGRRCPSSRVLAAGALAADGARSLEGLEVDADADAREPRR